MSCCDAFVLLAPCVHSCSLLLVYSLASWHAFLQFRLPALCSWRYVSSSPPPDPQRYVLVLDVLRDPNHSFLLVCCCVQDGSYHVGRIEWLTLHCALLHDRCQLFKQCRWIRSLLHSCHFVRPQSHFNRGHDNDVLLEKFLDHQCSGSTRPFIR